jgi:hypothetical protein
MVAIELSLLRSSLSFCLCLSLHTRYPGTIFQSVYNHGYGKLTYYVNFAVELAIER